MTQLPQAGRGRNTGSDHGRPLAGAHAKLAEPRSRLRLQLAGYVVLERLDARLRLDEVGCRIVIEDGSHEMQIASLVDQAGVPDRTATQ